MFRRLPFVSLFLLIVAVIPTLAQLDCPQLVLDALTEVGNNCTDLSRNNACYGHDRVDATFYVPQAEGVFTQPTDRADLRDMDTLQTYALDLDDESFGAAVMNVQASVPNTLPGQGVLFLMLGEASIDNAIRPENAARTIDAIPIPVEVDANLYSAPTETATIRLTAPAGELLPLDGLTPQGLWGRAIVNEQVLWVRRADLVQSAALNALPTVGSSQRAPMQAFYFSTGIGAPRCNEAESVIAIQSPEGLEVDMTVNGVDIRIGSLITLKTLDEETALLTVHRGSVQTTTGLFIQANESAIAQTGLNGGILRWEAPRPITEEEYERGIRVQEGLNTIARANDWEEQDVTPLDEPDPTPTPTESIVNATPTATQSAPSITGTPPQGDVYHVVVAGENLYRIALNYQASMPEIVEANDLSDPTSIVVGQRLLIPNAGSGFVAIDLPTSTPVPGDGNQGGTVADCSRFRLVYPTVNVPVGDTLYEWTAVSGATRYEAVFYDYQGSFAQSFSTNGPQTSLYLNTGRIPTGSELYWEVRAYADNEYLCVTPRSGLITRLAQGA